MTRFVAVVLLLQLGNLVQTTPLLRPTDEDDSSLPDNMHEDGSFDYVDQLVCLPGEYLNISLNPDDDDTCVLCTICPPNTTAFQPCGFSCDTICLLPEDDQLDDQTLLSSDGIDGSAPSWIWTGMWIEYVDYGYTPDVVLTFPTMNSSFGESHVTAILTDDEVAYDKNQEYIVNVLFATMVFLVVTLAAMSGLGLWYIWFNTRYKSQENFVTTYLTDDEKSPHERKYVDYISGAVVDAKDYIGPPRVVITYCYKDENGQLVRVQRPHCGYTDQPNFVSVHGGDDWSSMSTASQSPPEGSHQSIWSADSGVGDSLGTVAMV